MAYSQGSKRTYSTKQTKNQPTSRQVRWESLNPSDEENDSQSTGSVDTITQRAYAPHQTQIPLSLLGIAATNLLPPIANAVVDLVGGWVATNNEKSSQENNASSKPRYSYAIPLQNYPNRSIFQSGETYQHPNQSGQFFNGLQKTVPWPGLYHIQTPQGQSQNPSYSYSQYQPQIYSQYQPQSLPTQISTEPSGRGLYQPQKPPDQGQKDQYKYPQAPYQSGQISYGSQKTVPGPGVYQTQTTAGQNQSSSYSHYQAQTVPGQMYTGNLGQQSYQLQKNLEQGQNGPYRSPQGPYQLDQSSAGTQKTVSGPGPYQSQTTTPGQNPNSSYRYSLYQALNAPGQINPESQKPAQGPNQIQSSTGQGQTGQQTSTPLGNQDLRNTQDPYQPQNIRASRQLPSGPPKPTRTSYDQRAYQQQNFTGEGRAAGAGYSQRTYQAQSPTQYNTMSSVHFQLQNPSRQGQNITSGYQIPTYQPENSYSQMKSVPGPQYNSSQTPSVYQSTTAHSEPISPPPGTRFSLPGGSPTTRSSFKDNSYWRQNENRTSPDLSYENRTYSRRN